MKTITIYKECPLCYNDVEITINCSDDQFQDYSKNYKGLIIPKKAIQDIFPDMDVVKREAIKSGICPSCQKKIF